MMIVVTLTHRFVCYKQLLSTRYTTVFRILSIETKQVSKGEKERGKPRKAPNDREQSDGYRRGGECGRMKQVMGIKECTCCDEHWVLYGTVESLYCTFETNITLYVN